MNKRTNTLKKFFQMSHNFLSQSDFNTLRDLLSGFLSWFTTYLGVSNRSLKGNLITVHKDPEEKTLDIWDTLIWQATS